MNYAGLVTNLHNFSKFSKIVQSLKNVATSMRSFPLNEKFSEKSPSRCISFCQQQIKLEQFSQQNTYCRTALLQKSSLGAPKNRGMGELKNDISIFFSKVYLFQHFWAGFCPKYLGTIEKLHVFIPDHHKNYYPPSPPLSVKKISRQHIWQPCEHTLQHRNGGMGGIKKSHFNFP